MSRSRTLSPIERRAIAEAQRRVGQQAIADAAGLSRRRLQDAKKGVPVSNMAAAAIMAYVSCVLRTSKTERRKAGNMLVLLGQDMIAAAECEDDEAPLYPRKARGGIPERMRPAMERHADEAFRLYASEQPE